MTERTNPTVSKILSATATNTIDLSEEIAYRPHVFVGIQFRDADNLVVTPSAGTFSITVRTVGMANFESITDGDAIDATAALAALSFATNADELKYTPVGITGAVRVQITVRGNIS